LSDPDKPRLTVRLAWFAGLWIAGVVAVALVAGLIRLWLS